MKPLKTVLPLFSLVAACIFIAVSGYRAKPVDFGKSAASGNDAAANVSPVADKGERGPGNRTSEQYARHQAEQELQKEFFVHLNDAKMHFGSKKIPAALAALDRADVVIPGRCETLNLRGSCHVEMRQFDMALDEFKAAAEISKGNPSIQFNIGEVYFVTKRWQESLDVLKEVGRHLSPENVALGRLVEFKILLCLKQLGRNDEAHALAEKYDIKDHSPFPFYAKAAIAFEANEAEKAEDFLADAARTFPNPDDRAPWQDTLVEYGMIQVFHP